LTKVTAERDGARAIARERLGQARAAYYATLETSDAVAAWGTFNEVLEAK
jgi:hypothetical protein